MPRPRKTLRPKPRPQKVRLRVAPQLTRREVERLQAAAKADLRSVASYVAQLVERDLQKRSSGTARPVRGARLGDERTGYQIGMTLTVQQRKRLEAKADAQGRSLSGYVAKVIVEAVGR